MSFGEPASATAAGTAKKPALKKGIWFPAVPGTSIADKFKQAKAAGFEGVELHLDLNQDEIVRARDESGLVIATVACGPRSRGLVSPDPAKRAESVEGVKQALREAKRYGATSILVVPGDVTQNIRYDQAYQRVQTELRKVTPLAEELGVAIAIENVLSHFFLSPLEAARFVDEMQSPMMGWHFDVGNVMWLGWPDQWIRILGPRIRKVHAKEFSRKKMAEGGPHAGLAVEYLAGDADWPSVMRALGEVGYNGWFTAEPAWQPKGVDPVVRLKQVSEKMDQIMAA